MDTCNLMAPRLYDKTHTRNPKGNRRRSRSFPSIISPVALLALIGCATLDLGASSRHLRTMSMGSYSISKRLSTTTTAIGWRDSNLSLDMRFRRRRGNHTILARLCYTALVLLGPGSLIDSRPTPLSVQFQSATAHCAG